MTFTDLSVGDYYYDSPGYHLKCKTGAASYILANHIRRLQQVEYNPHRNVRETTDREHRWTAKKSEQVHWSED
jgi:hypothetical protein